MMTTVPALHSAYVPILSAAACTVLVSVDALFSSLSYHTNCHFLPLHIMNDTPPCSYGLLYLSLTGRFFLAWPTSKTSPESR